MVYCADKLIENSVLLKVILYKSNRPLFLCVYRRDNPLGNTRKACQSRAFGSWFTSFSCVLPTSRVGYHAGKPIESVVYCLDIGLFPSLRTLNYEFVFVFSKKYSGKKNYSYFLFLWKKVFFSTKNATKMLWCYPYVTKNIQQVEMIQGWAALWVLGRYDRLDNRAIYTRKNKTRLT